MGWGGLRTPAMSASRFTDASRFEAAGSHCEGPGFAEGRALHARRNGIRFTRACLPCALGSSITPGNHDTPWLASGPYLRTRRPRPSEKIAFRVVFALSALGDAHCGWPPRGGAGSARPQTRLCLHRWIAPLGHRHIINGPAQMTCLGLRMALPRGRTECVPPRKPPPALSPGFPRKAIPAWIADPAEGRALHARLAGFASTRGSPH